MKKSHKKYPLCGRAYSSMNPRNWVNYIYMTIILSEFFQFSAIIFSPEMPWLKQGSRYEDEPSVNFLINLLPVFLAGAVDEIQLGLLLTATTGYVVSIGWFLYLRKPPTDWA